jgi:hypothetical protein
LSINFFLTIIDKKNEQEKNPGLCWRLAHIICLYPKKISKKDKRIKRINGYPKRINGYPKRIKRIKRISKKDTKRIKNILFG